MAVTLSAAARRVQTALVAAGIAADVVELPASTRTASEAAAAIGCRVEQIAKSLVFRRADDGEPVLVIASGPNRVDEALLADVVGAPIARADAAFVRDATGFAIGGVPPLGHERPLPTLVDADLLALDRIWAAAGTPHAVFALTPAQLVAATGGLLVSVAARPPIAIASVARLDHVILAARDLDHAVAAFAERTGVRPAPGGKHPSGTQNALVSLGAHDYLEIIAPQPGRQPPPRFAGVLRADELTPIGWAVAATDVEALRSALASAGLATAPAQPGSRSTPDGATLRWQIVGLEPEPAGAPFFIVWDRAAAHPATSSPAGCALETLRVGSPQSAELARLRDALRLDVELTAANSLTITVTLRCPRGLVTFGEK